MQYRDRDLNTFVKQSPKMRPAGQIQSPAAKERDCDFAEKVRTVARLKEARLAQESLVPAPQLKPAAEIDESMS